MSSEWSGDMKWKTAVGDWSEELYVAAARDLLFEAILDRSTGFRTHHAD